MLHKNSSLGQRHPIHNWTPANSAALAAIVPAGPEDIGKVALQVDTGDFYALVDDSPATWVLLTLQVGDAPVTSVNGDTGAVTITLADLGYTDPVGKQTVWIPAAAMTARTTNGAAAGSTESTTNKVMYSTLDFDATTQEFAQFNITFPKSWNESTVTAQFYWTAASGTGTVVWGLQAVAISNDDAIDTAFGTAQEVSDALLATGDVHVTSETSAITIAGTPADGDLCFFQVYRDPADGSDSFSADAKLIGVKLYFTTDAVNDA